MTLINDRPDKLVKTEENIHISQAWNVRVSITLCPMSCDFFTGENKFKDKDMKWF